MKKIIALSCALAVLIGLLCGCTVGDPGAYVPTGSGLTYDDPTGDTQATQPPEETELELSMVYNVSASGNPFLCTDPSNRAWMSLLYQGLFAVDSDYTAWPLLCSEFWVSNDMMTYSFYVRDDATFSDGTPVTTRDVMASLEHAMKTDMYRGRFHLVRSL